MMKKLFKAKEPTPLDLLMSSVRSIIEADYLSAIIEAGSKENKEQI